MKLRIRGSALRLRLTRSEVARIAAGERVEEVTVFAPGVALRYVLQTSPLTATVRATFTDGRITVVLPIGIARGWAHDDTQVGIVAEQPGENGGPPLAILVEKDFACLDRPAEEQADAFANPAGDARC